MSLRFKVDTRSGNNVLMITVPQLYKRIPTAPVPAQQVPDYISALPECLTDELMNLLAVLILLFKCKKPKQILCDQVLVWFNIIYLGKHMCFKLQIQQKMTFSQ